MSEPLLVVLRPCFLSLVLLFSIVFFSRYSLNDGMMNLLSFSSFHVSCSIIVEKNNPEMGEHEMTCVQEYPLSHCVRVTGKTE